MHRTVLGGARGVLSFVLGLAIALGGVCRAQCEPGWSSWGATPGSTVRVVDQTLTWDHDADASTPRRVVVNQTTGYNEPRVAAMWDGVQWVTLGVHLRYSTSAMIAWDPDGPGPLPERLVIAARFTESDGTISNHVAYWDGSDWVRLGSRFNNSVAAIAVWDPDGDGPTQGQLVVGGSFTTVGGEAIHRVARWDGTRWVGLGSGIDAGEVRALTAWDPDGPGPLPERLVAGGTFATAGGVSLNRIGSWDGQAWSPIALGLSGNVIALAVWDADGDGPSTPDLIAGGSFMFSGDGIDVRGVARWDGTQWRDLGTRNAQTPIILALAVWDPDGDGPMGSRLVAGGDFSVIGRLATRNVASWDGTQWQAMDSGLTAGRYAGSVRALTVWDPDAEGPMPHSLIVAGNITGSDNAHLPGIGRWDGDRWYTFGTGFGGQVRWLTTWDVDGGGPLPERLFVYGPFDGVGPAPARVVTTWDGSSFHPGLPYWDYGVPLVFSTWDPDGPGPQVPKLVVGGTIWSSMFEYSGIAILDGDRWRGLNWSAANPIVYAITTWDPDGDGPLTPSLVVGGSFSGGSNSFGRQQNIAVWNGVTWSPLALGLLGTVQALATWDPDGPGPEPSNIVAGGLFGGGIARWDGSRWLSLGTGVNGGSVTALTTWDPDGDGPSPAHLIAGGTFTRAGSVLALSIARWDGTAWHSLGSGLSGPVTSLTTWDPDGSGPRAAELVAGGNFARSGEIPLKCVARWNGSQWRSFGVGLSDYVLSVASWDPDGNGPEAPRLFAGGNFTHAGGQPGAFLAYWSECPPACLGDFDGDGFLDFFDLDAYFACFEGGDCPAGRTADLDGDGFTDFFDLGLFLSSYEEGC